MRLDQTGFESFKEEIGRPQSADTTLQADASYDERDLVKDSESADEDNLEGKWQRKLLRRCENVALHFSCLPIAFLTLYCLLAR